MAFALGIIGEKSRLDLNHIRHIRNAFSHTRRNFTFETNEVAVVCERITLPVRFIAENGGKLPGFPMNTPRGNFQYAIPLYSAALYFLGNKQVSTIPLD